MGERDLARPRAAASADETLAEIVWWGARNGRSRISAPDAEPGHAVDLGDLERLLEPRAGAGSPAAAGRAWSCPPRADRPSEGCARRPRRSRAPASRPAWPRTSRRSGPPAAARAVGPRSGSRGLGGARAAEQARDLRAGRGPDHLHPARPGPPRAAFSCGHDHALVRRPRRAPSAVGERPADGPELAAERQLAADGVRASASRRHLAARREQPRPRSPGRSPGPPCARGRARD